MFLLVFLLMLFPASFILLVGLSICRAGQRSACAVLWAFSLVAVNISAYLSASADSPGIWLALAFGAPLVCVIFAVYSRFAQPRQDFPPPLSATSKADDPQTLRPPLNLRPWKIGTLALALLPISAIVITKFHMTNFDANVADCKQIVERALTAKTAANNCCETRLTCPAPTGFSAPSVSKDRLDYTGTLVGQGVILEAHLHAGAVVWECHVYPKIFGNRTCQGYEVGWH